jgi:predicted anti-sigma-YlaC factor YlaD
VQSRHALVCLLLFFPAACNVKQYALRQAADALSSTGESTAWTGDDDPELIRDSLPFALKTMESLLASEPDHVGLLTGLASGFTTYGYAFIQQTADMAQERSLAEAKRGWDRARKHYQRAQAYALRGLEVRHPGFTSTFKADAARAVKQLTAADVELTYWTAASLGALIGISKDRPEFIAEWPSAGVLMQRALALSPDWNRGAIHELLISFESRSEIMGGSLQRAQQHFERALALQQGLKAAPYVSWAENYCVARQDRTCFDEMLGRALAIDLDQSPGDRLANVIMKRRAEWLKSRAEDLILSSDADTSNPDM